MARHPLNKIGTPGIRKTKRVKPESEIQNPDDAKGKVDRNGVQVGRSNLTSQIRYELFCQEYIVNLNGVEAAKTAGYSESTCRSQASRLLSQPYIQKRIQQLMDERIARTQITADRALVEAARVAFSDVRKLFKEDGELKEIHEMDDETAAAVSSIQINTEHRVDKAGNPVPIVTKKIKLWDKNPALTNLMKNMKLLVDRVENTFPEKVHFIIER